MVAAAIGVSAAAGLAGSAISSSASQSAANTQAQAANNAQQLQWQQFQQLQQNLSPYVQLGTNNIGALQQMANAGFSFNPTEQQLASTPGYQFTLNQGLNTVNNQLAAKGLNLSGAQAKGISQYTTGLADTTYQQQYQNALQNFMTNYGVRSGLVSLGENAAAGVGNAGLQTAANAGNLLTQGANAQAAGTIGAANAASAGLGSLGNSALLYSLTNPTNAGGNIYGSAYNGFDNPANYG